MTRSIASSTLALLRAFAVASLLSLSACPGQELAALNPCTVSAATSRVDQTGVSQVDLLFMVDDSGSMANKQLRLAKELPRLINVLTSGDRQYGTPDDPTDTTRHFRPVTSLQLAVVTSSMGGYASKDDLGPNITAVALQDCLQLGSDGQFLNSTDIAVQGVTAQGSEFVGFAANAQVLPPDPDCSNIASPPTYQDYEAGMAPSATDVATSFTCVARVGVRGCPFEQQLESVWKALAPSDGQDPSLHQFVDGSFGGHGDPDGSNAGFIRDDAILAVMQVTDEEDCAITPMGRDLNSFTSAAAATYGPVSDINLRCYDQQPELDGLVWPPSRYITGLLSLKPDNQDRIIFAAIIGIPLDAVDQDFDTILARPEMQYQRDPQRDATGQTPFNTASCANPSDATEVSWPGRRIVAVAKGFGDNGVVYSICADDYAPALDKLIDRIAAKLTGDCLPRQLNPDPQGLVVCEIVEVLASGQTQCDPSRGHVGAPFPYTLQDGSKTEQRVACHMNQVPVLDGMPQADAVGWYYDTFSADLKTECPAGEQQRISFSFGDLPAGATAMIDCSQPVLNVDPTATGLRAVNTPCDVSNDTCSQRNDTQHSLVCVENNTCQVTCKANAQCPAGWVCASALSDSSAGTEYCQLPTCPASDQANTPQLEPTAGSDAGT